MSKNSEIKFNLKKRLTKSLDSFNSITKKEAIFDTLFNELESFDFEFYKKNTEEEIKNNLTEWWTNTKKGIIPNEELFAILFEYDYFLRKGVDAVSYGIGKWENFKIQTDKFDMGFNYDFTTQFYACPGITINFFDSLEILNHNKLKNEYKEKDIKEFKGYYEIIQLFQVKGMIAIHEVLEKLDNEGIFNKLNCKKNFMFIINEHDSSEVYPLLIKNKHNLAIPEIKTQKTNRQETIIKQSKKWWEIWK